jgi:hypothetical protein
MLVLRFADGQRYAHLPHLDVDGFRFALPILQEILAVATP